MPEHKLSYEHIANVLTCIRLVRGDGFEFAVSDYERIHAALYPEDEERLRVEPGHTLHETVGGRLYDYFTHRNGCDGPVIEKLSDAPDPRYRIASGSRTGREGDD